MSLWCLHMSAKYTTYTKCLKIILTTGSNLESPPGRTWAHRPPSIRHHLSSPLGRPWALLSPPHPTWYSPLGRPWAHPFPTLYHLYSPFGRPWATPPHLNWYSSLGQPWATPSPPHHVDYVNGPCGRPRAPRSSHGTAVMDNIVNPNSHQLTANEVDLLGLGITFIPSPHPKSFTNTELIDDFQSLRDTHMSRCNSEFVNPLA